MTQCIAAPGPDDLALLAYNDGNGDGTTAEHLRRCSHCRARAEALARNEARLSALLHRINCPSTEELQDYHFNFLPAAQIAAITAHAQKCPHCLRELATLAQFLESDAEEFFGWQPTPANQATPLPGAQALVQEEAKPGVAQRIRTVIATWLQGGQGGMTPALAGLRGAENSHQFYLAGDLQIGIDIQRDPKQANRREVLGTVLGLELDELIEAGPAALTDEGTDVGTDGGRARPTWQAHLWRDGQLVASAPLQELGSFVFDGLPPSDYELTIGGPNLAIHIASLTVS